MNRNSAPPPEGRQCIPARLDCILFIAFFFCFLFIAFYFLLTIHSFQLNSQEVFALSSLLDKPWSQASSLLPPGNAAFISIAQRVQFSRCSSIPIITRVVKSQSRTYIYSKSSIRYLVLYTNTKTNQNPPELATTIPQPRTTKIAFPSIKARHSAQKGPIAVQPRTTNAAFTSIGAQHSTPKTHQNTPTTDNQGVIYFVRSS